MCINMCINMNKSKCTVFAFALVQGSRRYAQNGFYLFDDGFLRSKFFYATAACPLLVRDKEHEFTITRIL